MIANVTVPDVLGGILFAALCIPFFIWCIKFGLSAGGFVGATITYQVPSPAEITETLRQQWGRAPSVEEVAAVQQILVNDHNQNLIAAGMLVGSAVLIHHELH